MNKGHNKKRNSGLLYEFLVRSISKSLVAGDKRGSNVALKLVRRHFGLGTELHREFRVINALLKTTVKSEAVAASIIQEAKLAARSHDAARLDKEKSILISSINRALNDDNFYDQHVNEYRMYATVQTLLNDWRSKDADLLRLARYEDQLSQWLTSERLGAPEATFSEEGIGTNRLLMKVMMQKLNEKYAGALNDDQRSLVRAFAFSTANDDPTSLHKKLAEIKQRLLDEIVEFSSRSSASEYLSKKLDEARMQIEGEALGDIDDETVTRFMLYAKLSSELKAGE
jgi:hypothetical protein